MGIKMCFSGIFILLLTVVGCASSDNDSNKSADSSKVMEKKSVSIPHSTVDMNVTMLEYQQGENIPYCRVKIEEILGYGPGVPPQAPGSEMEMEIAKNLIINGDLDSLDFSSEGKYNLRVTFQQGRSDGLSGQTWKIIKLNKITK